jgi:hypothetical protein
MRASEFTKESLCCFSICFGCALQVWKHSEMYIRPADPRYPFVGSGAPINAFAPRCVVASPLRVAIILRSSGHAQVAKSIVAAIVIGVVYFFDEISRHIKPRKSVRSVESSVYPDSHVALTIIRPGYFSGHSILARNFPSKNPRFRVIVQDFAKASVCDKGFVGHLLAPIRRMIRGPWPFAPAMAPAL